ncbi:response regulator [Natronorubrum sp. DTA28]|uniref:response regulator n=1 Tax=Natronorubrum sp. DTA28 TaxID=3447019 RepID=UPI003F86740A
MPTTVLLVDPTDDAHHFKTLFEETDRSSTVRIVNTGEDALDYLNKRGEYSDVPSPNLVILNPHLPQMDGYELLNEIKNEPVFKLVPVIVLSDSEVEDDIIESYTLHANAHLRKPDNPDEFEKVVTAIEAFWLDTAHLPPVK